MPKVGLTGSIGAGKSTVAQIFETLGIPVYYADSATKELYNSDAELKSELIKKFGDDIYDAAGTLDRARLAALVFDDGAKLEALNDLVHPAAIRSAEIWMAAQNAPYLIKEAALIFESGSASSLDYVIGVTAPLHLRIHRAMQRDSITREDVMRRERSQISESIKMKLCDFVLVNDEQQLLAPQVIALHDKSLLLAGKSS